MIKILSKFILNKIIGWKVIGHLPKNEKYIIAVVPHSSYFDLIIAVLIRTYSGLKIKFIGKRTLKIEGIKSLESTSYSVMSDRIETGTFCVAACLTGGNLKINNFLKTIN